MKIMKNEIDTKVLAKVLEKILDSKDSIQSIILDEEKSVSFTFESSAFEAILRLKHTLTETIKKQKDKELKTKNNELKEKIATKEADEKAKEESESKDKEKEISKNPIQQNISANDEKHLVNIDSQLARIKALKEQLMNSENTQEVKNEETGKSKKIYKK